MAFKIPLIKQRIDYFMNTKEMSLWHYSQYLETNDLRYFSNYYDLKNPKTPNQKTLEHSLALIFGEMLEISKSHEVVTRFNNTHRIYKLEAKYLDVKRLIQGIRIGYDLLDYKGVPILIEQLAKWHYKIKKDKDVLPQLDKIERRVEGIKSEIDSLKITLKKDNKQVKQDIDETIFYVQQGLEMNYKIDKKATTLYEWLLMQKSLKKKIDNIERNRLKNK